MNYKITPTVLVILFAIVLTVSFAFADHDDGDDVEDYEYVLQFDQQDLSKYVSFLVEEKLQKTYDVFFDIRKTIGGNKDPDNKNACEYRLISSGNIPIVIWGIPDSELLHKIQAWLDAHAEDYVQDDGKKHAFADPEILSAFRNDFGKQVIPIKYRPSPVMNSMLSLSGCGMHFLKAKGSALKKVTEKVKIVNTADSSIILPVSYLYEYTGHPDIFITAEQARTITKADIEKLLNVDGVIKPVFTEPLEPMYDNRKNVSMVIPLQRAESPLHIEWLWFIGGPIIGSAGLITLYFRKRRNGK